MGLMVLRSARSGAGQGLWCRHAAPSLQQKDSPAKLEAPLARRPPSQQGGNPGHGRGVRCGVSQGSSIMTKSSVPESWCRSWV